MLPLALFTCVVSAAFVPTPAYDFDVVVYGGTPGGVQAALAAANEGLSVLLATPQTLLGGMMSGGLGETDVGNSAAIGGASLAFFLDICRAYGDIAPTKPCFKFEPHVAQGVFEHLVAASPRVTVRLNTTLLETTQGAAGVATVSFVPTNAAEAAPIFTAAALAGVADVVSARAFIDATYEGDLIAAAGIATAVGREAVTTYNESHAGVLAEPSTFGSHQFCPGVDAIDHTTGLPLPFISRNPPGAVGSGDAMVQAYNFRLTMTRNASNLVPFMQPANYRDADWEIARRFVAKCNKTSFSSLMNLSPIPNAKTDTNNNGAVSTDFIGGSWAWPAATPLARRAIYTAHREYTEGFMWFLQHDASLPASIRAEAVTWGLAADEYDGKGWSPQLYVREGRRMVSDFIFRQQDRQTDIRKPDSIGLFSYNVSVCARARERERR